MKEKKCRMLSKVNEKNENWKKKLLKGSLLLLRKVRDICQLECVFVVENFPTNGKPLLNAINPNHSKDCSGHLTLTIILLLSGKWNPLTKYFSPFSRQNLALAWMAFHADEAFVKPFTIHPFISWITENRWIFICIGLEARKYPNFVP